MSVSKYNFIDLIYANFFFYYYFTIYGGELIVCLEARKLQMHDKIIYNEY